MTFRFKRAERAPNNSSFSLRAASSTALPAMSVTRLPQVPRSACGVMAVSAAVRRMSSTRSPSSSARICTSTESDPCPMSAAMVSRCTVPSAKARISAGGERILGVEPVEHAAGDEAVASHADPPRSPARVGLAFLPPAAHLRRLLQRLGEPAAGDGGHVRDDVAGAHGVLEADVDGVDTELLGGHVHLRFGDEERLRGPEASHGAGRRLVGVDVAAPEAVGRVAVEHGPEVAAEEGGGRPHGVVGAAVQEDLAGPWPPECRPWRSPPASGASCRGVAARRPVPPRG